MIRVVVDTNVYVSALVFGGTPALAFQVFASAGMGIVTSAEIRDELKETLIGKFHWDADGNR